MFLHSQAGPESELMQRPLKYLTIRGQHSGHVISIDQSEAGILYKCLPIFTRVLDLAEVMAGLTDTLCEKRIRIKTLLQLPKNVWKTALHYSQLLYSNNFLIMRVVRLVKGSLLIFFHYLMFRKREPYR